MVGSQSSDGKLRQSSGGRSFFGRRKEKAIESQTYDDVPPTPSFAGNGSNSAAGSKSSRHSRRPSDTVEVPERGDAAGLHMTAGVITSIPYDSVSNNNKTPIPVEYLPRQDQVPARREPLPHHLNKGGGDFHQYPAWEPTPQAAPRPSTNGSSHPTGPRPPPQAPLSVTAQMRDASLRDRHSHKSNATYAPQNTNSYSTESSHNGRNSFDQASIHSTVSSHTGRSSVFSSEDTSRTVQPPHPTEYNNALRPTSSHSSAFRQSTASAFHGGHSYGGSYNSATSFTPEGFHLPRPTDDAVIEQQFVALMHKRGWQNLPDQARRQMMAYPPGKKWTLVHQDRLTEWQGEQKRRQNARQTIGNSGADGPMGVLARADEEGSPEWYVKRILDDSIDAKQLQSLSVSLRTQPIK